MNTFCVVNSTVSLHLASIESGRGSWSFMSALRRQPLSYAVGLLLVITGMTGAIAALGDTLYNGFGSLPLQAYLDGDVPVLLRLRLIHPIVSCLTAATLLYHQAKFWKLYEDRKFGILGWSVSIMTLIQVALGFINVQLMAPVWMQIVHLAAGVLLWTLYSFLYSCC